LDRSLHHEPSYIEFTLCVTSPFLKFAPSWQPLRHSMEKCFLQNQISNPLDQANNNNSIDNNDKSSSTKSGTKSGSSGGKSVNYGPCMNVIENIDARGRADLDVMFRNEPHQTSQIAQALTSYRKQLNHNERIHRQLNCVAYPEHSKCSTLRTNMFSEVSQGACSELFVASTKCFETQAKKKKKALWKHIFLSEDLYALASYKNYCDQVQRDMMRCAEKYFRLAVISYDMERTLEMIDPDFRRNIMKQEWGIVTKEQRQEAEEKMKLEKKEMEELYAKYKQQQEGD